MNPAVLERIKRLDKKQAAKHPQIFKVAPLEKSELPYWTSTNVEELKDLLLEYNYAIVRSDLWWNCSYSGGHYSLLAETFHSDIDFRRGTTLYTRHIPSHDGSVWIFAHPNKTITREMEGILDEVVKSQGYITEIDVPLQDIPF